MSEILDTTQQIVLSVRMRGDATGPQTGDVVLEGNMLHGYSEEESYNKDEVIVKDGEIYRAKEEMNPGEWDANKWELLTDITIRINDFIPDHFYTKNEVIQHNGHLYRAPNDLTTTSEFDATLWEPIDSVNTILNNFEPKSDYSANEVIVHNGKIYRARKQFISGDQFILKDWELIGDLIVEDFQKNKDYHKGNIIISSGKLYRAKRDFTSGTAWQAEYWEPVNSTGVGGFSSNTFYPAGSMIYVDGKLYVTPDDLESGTEFDPRDWEVASETVVNNFANNHIYQQGELVYYNGSLYRARKAFTSGEDFVNEDWELLSATATGGFQPQTEYLEGTIIYHNGILWIAKKTFVSGDHFDPSDWKPLTQTEQETYDSWNGTGTTVVLDELNETFRNKTDSNISMNNNVNSAIAAVELTNTNSDAKLQATSGESRLTLSDEDSSSILTSNGIRIGRGDTFFRIDVSQETVEMSDNMMEAFTSKLQTASKDNAGVVKVDDTTVRMDEDTISSFPIPAVYAAGHRYEQFELCTYKNQVWAAREKFTAATWDAAQWYPIHTTFGTYATDNAYAVGDTIVENNQVFFALKEISAAPASRVAKDWQALQVSGDNVVLNTINNRIAVQTNLNDAITELDGKVATSVQPNDNTTEYLLTTQRAGTNAPKAVNGKTIICIFTE